MIIRVLQIIAALGTFVTGFFALLKPTSVEGFTGINAKGARGITEIRAVFGGFFIALGIAPLILQSPTAYHMLGIAYLVVAAIKINIHVCRQIRRSV